MVKRNPFLQVYLSLVGSHTANQIRIQTIDKHSEPESRLRDGGKALTQRVGKFLQNAEQELNAITTFDQLIEMWSCLFLFFLLGVMLG